MTRAVRTITGGGTRDSGITGVHPAADGRSAVDGVDLGIEAGVPARDESGIRAGARTVCARLSAGASVPAPSAIRAIRPWVDALASAPEVPLRAGCYARSILTLLRRTASVATDTAVRRAHEELGADASAIRHSVVRARSTDGGAAECIGGAGRAARPAVVAIAGEVDTRSVAAKSAIRTVASIRVRGGVTRQRRGARCAFIG